MFFEKKYLTMIPGPLQVNQKVLKAMARQVETHGHEDWDPFYRSVCEKLKKVFFIDGDVYAMVSSGTGAMESAISSILEPGDRILGLKNGYFGSRFKLFADAYHFESETISFPSNEAIDPDVLKKKLQKEAKKFSAVGAVQSESQNGILNPIKEISIICQKYGIPLIVDAVSAIGGVELKMDEWGVDIAVGSTQKCIGGVVGIGMVAINKKAWKFIENKKGTGVYFNLNEWRESMKTNVVHPHPWSMSDTLLFGLDEALDEIFEEGLENRWKRHWNLYEYYVQALKKLGFEMYVPRSSACPTVISINQHPKISATDLISKLRNEYRILVGGGLFEQRGKIWRIGNMAEQATTEKAKKLVKAVTEIVQSVK
jgi:aspartate aminotransferase-like enzyme